MFMTLMSNKLYDRIKYLFYEPLVYGYDNNNTVYNYYLVLVFVNTDDKPMVKKKLHCKLYCHRESL